MLYLRKILSSIIDVIVIVPGLIILFNIIYNLIAFVCKNEDIEIIIFVIICMLTLYMINFLFVKKDSIKGNRSIGKKIMKLYIYDEENNIVEDKLLLEKRNKMNKEHWINCIIDKMNDALTPGDLICVTHVDKKEVSDKKI